MIWTPRGGDINHAAATGRTAEKWSDLAPFRGKRMSALGHLRLSHSVPVSAFVRCYSNSDQLFAAQLNDVMCH